MFFYCREFRTTVGRVKAEHLLLFIAFPVDDRVLYAPPVALLRRVAEPFFVGGEGGQAISPIACRSRVHRSTPARLISTRAWCTPRLGSAIDVHLAIVLHPPEYFRYLLRIAIGAQLQVPGEVALLRIEALRGWQCAEVRGHRERSHAVEHAKQLERIISAREESRPRPEADAHGRLGSRLPGGGRSGGKRCPAAPHPGEAPEKGRFALADGGTIFLDEIGVIAPSAQAKLLRVLQEREFEPVGSDRTVRVDVRVIAATNRDLRQLVADGRFQEDLYYRLNVIPIAMPPLRERREDIPLLVEHFVRRHAGRAGKRIDGISDEAIAALTAAPWPGNVRELENTIERAVVLSPGPVIDAADITMPGVAGVASPGLPSLKLRSNVDWVEQQTIRQALERSGGVKKDAATLLGISQRALSYYLAKYRVE